MGDIKFDFSLDKLINAIALFSGRGIADLTKLKIAKLLYFADKKHLLEYGRPILGDVYWCMDFGPVPSLALLEMNEAINKSEVATEDYSSMSKMLRVRRPFFNPRYPHFEATHPFDSKVFAPSELNVLEQVIVSHGGKTANDLVQLTHEESPWKISNEQRTPGHRTLIPYELFFEGAPQSAQKHLARLKADFCGEVISLDSDVEYAEFAGDLRGHRLDHDFDLDSDHARNRATAR